MAYRPRIHHRKSIRLKGYDYTQPGAYFITVATKNREPIFGAVVGGAMRLTAFGEIARAEWLAMGTCRAGIGLDAFIVMPDHMHGIIVIGTDESRRGGSRPAPTTPPIPTAIRKPIGQLVGMFKMQTAKRINIARGTIGAAVWQRNYYEHIIRNDADLDRIRKYILDNPARWDRDGK